MSSLVGIWKLSATLRRGATVALPKRLRFDETSPTSTSTQSSVELLLPADALLLHQGKCSLPYMEHCHGFWQVASADDDAQTSGALRAGFVIQCAAHGDVKASHLIFRGLFDGERIAGNVSSRDADGSGEIGDFLCTRLFTFWGTPKVQAGIV